MNYIQDEHIEEDWFQVIDSIEWIEYNNKLMGYD